MIQLNYKKDYMLWIFSLLIILPLFFRGLFFQQDFAIFSIIALVFVVINLIKKDIEIKFNLFTDLTLFILVLFYIISSFAAVNINLAIGEAIKYLAVYILYLVAKSFFKTEEKAKFGLIMIVAAVALVSLISLISATGLLVYKGSYSSSEIEKWLNGTVQYHNAFGALTLMAMFMACSFAENSFKSVQGWIITVCTYFITFGLIMSYSRGAWVLAPIIFVIYMIFSEKEKRVAFFALIIPAVVSVIAVLSKFSQNVDSQNGFSALLWLLIGLIIFAVLYTIFTIILNKLSPMKYFNITAILIVVLGALLGALAVFMPHLFSAIIPARLVERLSGINFGSETVQERFVFYNDAFNIAKRNLLIGNGGGAWQDLYGAVQSYLYYSTQAHSFIMQILVESGILGAIAWVGTIVLFYFISIAALIKKSISRNVLSAIVCGGTALILHSFIDFDLSIVSITIILWTLIAMLSSLASVKEFTVSKYITSVISSILVILFFVVFVSYNANEKGLSLIEKQKFQDANKQFATASALNPFNAEYLSNKAYALAAYTKKVDERKQAASMFEKAERLAPNNLAVQQTGVMVYSYLGSPEYAFKCIEKTISLQPLNPENYMSYLKSAVNIIPKYMADGVYDKAKAMAQKSLEVINQAQSASEGKLKPVEMPEEISGYTNYFNKVANSIN